AIPADPIDEELIRLREEVGELQAEVKRLRALVADGSARHELHRLIAANELQHGDLYEELLGLIVDDPEGVAEDPRRAFELIVRLIDESGLAGAKVVDGQRELAPEPAAPELLLTLRYERGTDRFDSGDGTGPFECPADDVQFFARLTLPKAPEGWLGHPLSATVGLTIHICDRIDTWLNLDMDLPTRIAPSVFWGIHIRSDEACLDRLPLRGGDASRVTSPAEFAIERAWLDRIFEQLRTRAR